MTQLEDFEMLSQSIDHLTMRLQKLVSRLNSVERPPAHAKHQESTNPMHHKEYWESKGRGHGGGFQAVQGRHPREVHHIERTGSIKPKLPKFFGSTNPEEYIKWEKQVDRVFDCHTLSEERKVKLIVAHLRDYAITWWDKLFLSRRKNLEHSIDSWYVLKPLMREHFVPKRFHKLQTLRQGSKGVKTYYKEMLMLLEDLDLHEGEEASMNRFFRGLNKEIAIRLELQPYKDLEEMVYMAIKIEKHLQRKSTRYTKPKVISSVSSSFEKVSLPTEIKPIVQVESDKIQNEILCNLVPMHAENVLFNRQFDCKDLFDCNTSTIVTPILKEEYFVVCELEKKAEEAETKACESIENKSCEKMSEREKHEISLWPKEKNERKAKNVSLCERTWEAKSILFSKQNILEHLYKGACFLMGELQPCFSSVSFEFLQEAKALIEKLDSKIASKFNHGGKHVVYKAKAFIEKQNSIFASKFINRSKHKVFKLGDWVWRHYWKDQFTFGRKSKWKPRRARHLTSQDYKIALQGEGDVTYVFNAADFHPFEVGDNFDSRTNPFEEGEDDMNH